MDEEIPKKIYDFLLEESNSSKDDPNAKLTYSSLFDFYKKTKKKKSEEDIKLEILENASNNANYISKLVTSEEEHKNFWRKYFIIFFSVLLGISLVFVGTIIILNSSKIIEVSDQIIMGAFIYIIANILTILYFMVKYVNSTEYLKMFRIVSYKMLDFLVQDKGIEVNEQGREKKPAHSNKKNDEATNSGS